MGAVHRCDSWRRQGEGLSALFLYPTSTVPRKCHYLCQLPWHIVMWHTSLCGRSNTAIDTSAPHKKRICSSSRKMLLLLLLTIWLFSLSKPKGWNSFFFLHKKIKFLSRKWKLVRPIASPSMVVWSMLACHISSMLTLEYHNSVRVCFLRCRDISSSTGRLSEMWRRASPASLLCHICQFPSAEPVSQQEYFFMLYPAELAYFLSSLQCHC